MTVNSLLSLMASSKPVGSHAVDKQDRQVASSQLTDSKGKQLIAISQTKSDTQPGNKLTSLAGDKHVQAGSQVVQDDRQQTHGYLMTMADC